MLSLDLSPFWVEMFRSTTSLKITALRPLLLLGMLGRIDNVDKAVTMEVKNPGSSFFLIGKRGMNWVEANTTVNSVTFGANLPKPDFAEVREELKTVIAGIDQGLISAAHDISDGGLLLPWPKCFVEAVE